MARSVTIITGAGRGIGRAAAVEFAKAGDELVLVARTEAELVETQKLAGRGIVVARDIAKDDAAAAIVDRAMKEFGRVDAVVHCAGIAPMRSVEDTTPQLFREVLDTNLTAAFLLARACWPIFRHQRHGVVVNLSSYAARDPFGGFFAYGPAKAGVNLLGLALARDGAPHGIRVHTIAPGAVETALLRSLATPQQFPTERTLSPSDVARMIVQCVHGDLRHTSGEVIYTGRSTGDA